MSRCAEAPVVGVQAQVITAMRRLARNNEMGVLTAVRWCSATSRHRGPCCDGHWYDGAVGVAADEAGRGLEVLGAWGEVHGEDAVVG